MYYSVLSTFSNYYYKEWQRIMTIKINEFLLYFCQMTVNLIWSRYFSTLLLTLFNVKHRVIYLYIYYAMKFNTIIECPFVV